MRALITDRVPLWTHGLRRAETFSSAARTVCRGEAANRLTFLIKEEAGPQLSPPEMRLSKKPWEVQRVVSTPGGFLAVRASPTVWNEELGLQNCEEVQVSQLCSAASVRIILPTRRHAMSRRPRLLGQYPAGPVSLRN